MDKHSALRKRHRKPALPRNIEQFNAAPLRRQQTLGRATNVISRMRADGVSLYRAAREIGIDPRTVIRLGGSALRKQNNGRFRAKRTDRLLRVLNIPSHDGRQEIAIRDSRQASLLAKYSDAVQTFLATGNAEKLQAFEGKSIIDADGNSVPLITSLNELDELGSAGELSFESLYARTA